MDIHLTLLHGDNRDVMRTLPAQSVQAIITSPPYWMKRKYNTPPVVYGGDAACVHEWREGTFYNDAPARSMHIEKFSKVAPIAGSRTHATVSCAKCGAWRGELGWEPRPSCDSHGLFRLRRDLSDAEREEVVAELRRRGVIR